MKPEISWIDDPRVFRVNQMPAHSDHTFYESEEAYREGRSTLKQMLNGTWKFSYADRVDQRQADFYKEDYDASGWDEIRVPGHIELAGYDRIKYANIQYPWEGHEYLRPPFAPSSENQRADAFSGSDYCPVGSYRLEFDVEEGLCGKDISLFFEGVEQAVYVWLNGVFIGYGEDSFTPTEFGLSGVIREKGNVLAVEVYKKTVAAYLEDQDFFRFFGIFRDVYLVARPAVHLEDLWLRPQYDPAEQTGVLSACMDFSGKEGGQVKLTLLDAEGQTVAEKEQPWKEKMELILPVPGKVRAWSHGDPYLYRVEIRVMDPDGGLTEVVPYDIGFRKIEIRDKVMKLNGERLVFCGVNRHEWSADSGRCIGEKERQWDMECFKRNHINAVRTCHYPDQIPWYYLFHPQLGVKLCSMAGGGVQKIYMVLLREPSRRDRSGSDLFHLRDGFEIKMNFDRNVSCFIFVNAFMHDDFFD